MQITKLGHCCLLIDLNGAPNSRPFRILTDPGTFTTAQDSVTGVDCVLITHEHQDHFHLDSVKRVLANNPNATVITNGSVGKLLAAAGVAFRKVADGEEAGVSAAGSGGSGASASGTSGAAGTFFYPGDAFYKPPRAVDILALPVAGPWCKFSEAVDYALAVKPRVAFPVHDAVLSPGSQKFVGQMLTGFLKEGGVEFNATEIGKEMRF